MTFSTEVYRAVARLLAQLFLREPLVVAVYARRSVAHGDAEFPWSDLDLGMVIHPATGSEIDLLRKRFATARLAFPRLGECQVYTKDELSRYVENDPYRASLDRRARAVILGPMPEIDKAAISKEQSARRLIFWWETFVPDAIRRKSPRRLRKFALEMANALGVLEGRWDEPLLTRTEVEARYPLESKNWLILCEQLPARAHELLFAREVPLITQPVRLKGLTILPPRDPTSITEIGRTGGMAMPAHVLDLLLHTQTPWLWNQYGKELEALGFLRPADAVWQAAARRYAAGDRVRGPGFADSHVAPALQRLRLAADVLMPGIMQIPDRAFAIEEYYPGPYDKLLEISECMTRTPRLFADRTAK